MDVVSDELRMKMKHEDGPNELKDKEEESPETNLETEKRETDKDVDESEQSDKTDERIEIAIKNEFERQTYYGASDYQTKEF